MVGDGPDLGRGEVPPVAKILDRADDADVDVLTAKIESETGVQVGVSA